MLKFYVKMTLIRFFAKMREKRVFLCTFVAVKDNTLLYI